MKTKNKTNSRPKPLHKRLGLAHKRHTGSPIAFKHSSFGALFFLLLLFAPHFIVTRGVNGVITSSGNVQVTATVPGPAPTTPAIITSPTSGTVTSQTITVAGTCGPDLLVKIFRNDIFAGSTYCSSSGTFSLNITLYSGRNDLRALNYDSLDQAGPASVTVTVTYAVPQSIINKTPLKAANLLLQADYRLRQVEPNIIAKWKFTLNFGAAPYNIEVNWGDENHDIKTLSGSGDFELQHTYGRAGKYRILITATDANGAKTSVQLAVTVNGETAHITTANATRQATPSPCSANTGNWWSQFNCRLSLALSQIWLPLYWLIVTVVGCMWVLSRVHKHENRHRNLAH